MSKRYLILSPFAPAPRDAGHRRRLVQTLEMLRDRGASIDFLHVRFEDPWRWRSPIDLEREIGRLIDGYFPVEADSNMGLPPKTPPTHTVDEWWGVNVERSVKEAFHHRAYDGFVIHNVWLSKAFDFCPPRTTKILETHDLFWPRGEFYERTGTKLEFYLPTKEEELRGISRADVVVMIQEQEADILRGEGIPGVVTVPYWPSDVKPDREREWLHPDRIVFGMIGTAHPFNIRGLQELGRALDRVIGESFAPIEFVVAGALCNYWDARSPARLLGFVEREEEFYSQVDFVCAPVFDGSGLKVKVVDALARNCPLIVSAHAAKGIRLPDDVIAEDADEMAEKMRDLSFARQSRLEVLRKFQKFADINADETADAAVSFKRAIIPRQPILAFDCVGGDGKTCRLRLASALAYSHLMEPHVSFAMLVGSDVAGRIRDQSLDSVRFFLGFSAFIEANDDRRAVVITSYPRRYELRTDVIFVFDDRFADRDESTFEGAHRIASNIGSDQGMDFYYLPIMTKPFFWAPVVNSLKQDAKRERKGIGEPGRISEIHVGEPRRNGAVSLDPDGRLYDDSALLLGEYEEVSKSGTWSEPIAPVIGDLIAQFGLSFRGIPSASIILDGDLWHMRQSADEVAKRVLNSLLKAR